MTKFVRCSIYHVRLDMLSSKPYPSVTPGLFAYLIKDNVLNDLCGETLDIIEPRNEISNNVVCATSRASDQPAHTRSLIRAFATRLDIL